MKFTVGLPCRAGERGFFEDMRGLLDGIAELYFPWPGEPSGRSALGEDRMYVDYGAVERLLGELAAFRAAGVELDLLLNSSCYGAGGASAALERRVRSILCYLGGTVGLPESVTTASPAVAHVVKRDFPGVRTRASVNMRIGTVEGMEYLSDLFDEYVMQRDFNRDLERVAQLAEWAGENGKRLSMLANSGCLRNCSGQTFHDNLVAHGTEAETLLPMEDFVPHTCARYFTNHPERLVTVMRGTWVRPEDIGRYERYFDRVKLATRLHPSPWLVARAYINRSFSGNLLDLLEPGFTALFEPAEIDNRRIPPDWFDRALACDKSCRGCDICANALRAALAKQTANTKKENDKKC